MLVYDDTLIRERGQAVSAPDSAAGTTRRRGVSIGIAAAVLRRRVLWIAGFAIVGALTAFVVGKALTPKYTAEAQLFIDPRDLRVVEKELTAGGQDSTAFMTIVESQAQVITSSKVLGRVIAELDLARDPEFAGQAGPGLIGGLALSLGLTEPPVRDATGGASSVLDALAKRVAVRRTGRTFIVDVTAWSREADKAARIANGVVAAYLAEEAATRADAANRASTGLTSQLVELREAVNRAESRVQAYKADNGLVGTRDTLVSDQQLTQLNAQLATARVRAADAQARVDQLQRIQSSGNDVGATEDALASQAIASMRTQYAELSRKQAELLHDLGPRHPLVTSIASQIQQARRLIDQEIGRYVQAARSDLARAQSTVTMLERSFDTAKNRTVGQAEASIRLRELEREVDASRAVYAAFLVRARETGQQARLDVSNARVITPAVMPLVRSYPAPAKVLAGLGLVAGLLLGIALALGEDWLRRDMRAAASAKAAAAAPPAKPARRGPLPEAIEVLRHSRGSGVTLGHAVQGGLR